MESGGARRAGRRRWRAAAGSGGRVAHMQRRRGAVSRLVDGRAGEGALAWRACQASPARWSAASAARWERNRGGGEPSRERKGGLEREREVNGFDREFSQNFT